MKSKKRLGIESIADRLGRIMKCIGDTAAVMQSWNGDYQRHREKSRHLKDFLVK